MLEITGKKVYQWLKSDTKAIYEVSSLWIFPTMYNTCINSSFGPMENCRAGFLEGFWYLHTPGKIIAPSNWYYPEGRYRQLLLCCSLQHSIDRLVDGAVPTGSNDCITPFTRCLPCQLFGPFTLLGIDQFHMIPRLRKQGLDQVPLLFCSSLCCMWIQNNEKLSLSHGSTPYSYLHPRTDDL